MRRGPKRSGFLEELTKLCGARTFPISRTLTAPLSLVEMGRGALSAGVVGHAIGGSVGAAVGGTAGAVGGLMEGVGHSLATRRNFAQSTLGRILRGGQGMMQGEKARLAEGLGLSRDRFDQIVANVARRRPHALGAQEDFYSRLANTKSNPIAALERFVSARALAGRVAKGDLLLQHEADLIETLRAAERRQRLADVARRAAPYLTGAATATGAGLGGYAAYRRINDHRNDQRRQNVARPPSSLNVPIH